MEWIEKSNIFFRWTFYLLKMYLFYQLWYWGLRSHMSHRDAGTGTERTNHLLQYQFVYITTIKQYYKPKPYNDYAIGVHLALCNFLIWNKNKPCDSVYVTFWQLMILIKILRCTAVYIRMTVKVIEVLITLKFTFFFPSYKSTT